jgi:hypothetical protein
MMIIAKYAELCPQCGLQIHVGNQIEWTKGQKGIHVECLEKITVTESGAIKREYPKEWGRKEGVDYTIKTEIKEPIEFIPDELPERF